MQRDVKLARSERDVLELSAQLRSSQEDNSDLKWDLSEQTRHFDAVLSTKDDHLQCGELAAVL